MDEHELSDHLGMNDESNMANENMFMAMEGMSIIDQDIRKKGYWLKTWDNVDNVDNAFAFDALSRINDGMNEKTNRNITNIYKESEHRRMDE